MQAGGLAKRSGAEDARSRLRGWAASVQTHRRAVHQGGRLVGADRRHRVEVLNRGVVGSRLAVRADRIL